MKEILAPISIGELYDKISILEIKLYYIEDEKKQINIKYELSKLRLLAETHLIDEELYQRLKNINLRLWYIEDKIRENEKIKLYDESFINLAKSVYYKNDERSEIKKEINYKYSSVIIEEKQYKEYK